MSIEKIRFRSDGDKVVLQVMERTRGPDYGYGHDRKDTLAWRDATVQDLLEVAQFTRAHDYLDTVISNLMSEVSSVREELERHRSNDQVRANLHGGPGF